jgi:hypothetical protein
MQRRAVLVVFGGLFALGQQPQVGIDIELFAARLHAGCSRPFVLHFLRRFSPEQALQHEWAKSQAPAPLPPSQPAAPLPFFDAPKPPVKSASGGLSARGEAAQAAKGLQMPQPQPPAKGYLNMAFRDRHLFPPLDLGNKFLAQQPQTKVRVLRR